MPSAQARCVINAPKLGIVPITFNLGTQALLINTLQVLLAYSVDLVSIRCFVKVKPQVFSDLGQLD